MLVRLMYASRAAEGLKADALHAIVKKSTTDNAKHGITGVLCFSGQVFLQALEGGRSQVNALYHRIAVDPRHHDVVLLSYDEIAERRFASWAMGQVDMQMLNPALLLKYSEVATLDPYAVSGTVSMALFNELVATASVVCHA